MGAISPHGGHLDLQTVAIFTNVQFPINTRLHIRFEEIWPRVSEEKCERKDGRMDHGWRVITIALPEPLAQVS